LSFPFPRSLPLVYTLPNDLPSNPGQALVLFLLTPFSLSLFHLLHVAILSDRIFCFAAIEIAGCSFRSSQAFLLFPFVLFHFTSVFQPPFATSSLNAVHLRLSFRPLHLLDSLPFLIWQCGSFRAGRWCKAWNVLNVLLRSG